MIIWWSIIRRYLNNDYRSSEEVLLAKEKLKDRMKRFESQVKHRDEMHELDLKIQEILNKYMTDGLDDIEIPKEEYRLLQDLGKQKQVLMASLLRKEIINPTDVSGYMTAMGLKKIVEK